MKKTPTLLFVFTLATMATCATGRALAVEVNPIISDLRSLVEVNSGTSNVSGVEKIQDRIGARLKKMGFQVSFTKNSLGADKSGELLVGELPGRTGAFVTFIMHADTVFEPSSPFQKFRMSDDGTKAFGPGVIDDKGGVLVALQGLENYLRDHKPEYSLRVVSSPDEETGSPGFVDVMKKFAADSVLVLGFEPALDSGDIISSRRGDMWYHIQVTGKEAHAGRAHAEGINACLDLSTKLVEISKLTNYAKDVTVSVGHIIGGQDKYNIVCGSAEAKVDTRFATLEDRAKLQKKLEGILKRPSVFSKKTGEPAKIEFQVVDDAPPYSMTRESKPYVNKYLEGISQAEGSNAKAEKSGGAGDTNYLSRQGMVIFDGLGPVGGKMHTADEFIILSSLQTRARALTSFLISLEKR